MIKILFLAANPAATTPLRLDAEIRAIDAALRQTEYRSIYQIEKHFSVRVTDIQELLLRHQPHIVHFSGHGSNTNEIIVEDQNGNIHSLSSRALSDLFSILGNRVRCVILNACYSKVQAAAIANAVDCVVGMSTGISDTAAISFATSFYQALGYGKDIKTAFELGRSQIDLENLGEQDTPELLTKYPEAALTKFTTAPQADDDSLKKAGLETMRNESKRNESNGKSVQQNSDNIYTLIGDKPGDVIIGKNIHIGGLRLPKWVAWLLLGVVLIGGIAMAASILPNVSAVLPTATPIPPPTATQTPSPTPPPTDAIPLPTAPNEELSVSVDFQSKLPGYVITKKLDRKSLLQTIDLEQDILNEKENQKFVVLMNQIFLPSWSINIAGKVDGEGVLLYGESIPIQIVSYRPITEDLDLILVGYGGGVDLFTYLTDISKRTLSLPDRIVEAFPDPCTDMSSGNEECIKGKISPPKFINLKHNERVSFDIRTPFKYHGIYQARLGVRYTYQGYERIAWADPPIEIIVPQSYYSWMPSSTSANPNDYMIRGKCIWVENGEYDCNSDDLSMPKEPSNVGQPVVNNFRACPEPCNETNAMKTFPEKTEKIYAQWSFINIPNGADYVRIWTMNGQEWARYTCKWDGSVSGIQKVELREPMGLHSGLWEMRIIINNQVLLQEQIEVTGSWNYWLPAGAVARCNS